jgi:hypothetical protein
MGMLFVTIFAFTPKSKTNLYWFWHPDTRICTQLKSCSLTNFWLRDSLYRDAAPVPATKYVTGDKLAAPQTCTTIAPASNKICTMTAKTRAIPYLHRDSFLTKVPGPFPVLASGNTTSPSCRAERQHSPHYLISAIINKD